MPDPTRPLSARAPRLLCAFFTPRFLKFAAVGASGVVVNLSLLSLAIHLLDLRSTAASAVAIQGSILSNFFINERWTFADQRHGAWPTRLARFQLVSLFGAAIQFTVFVCGNLFALALLSDTGALAHYFAAAPEAAGLLERYVLQPIVHPPEVGGWVYPSQLAGIAFATAWNFLANLRWTWGERA